jgi:hypothetical protein
VAGFDRQILDVLLDIEAKARRDYVMDLATREQPLRIEFSKGFFVGSQRAVNSVIAFITDDSESKQITEEMMEKLREKRGWV